MQIQTLQSNNRGEVLLIKKGKKTSNSIVLKVSSRSRLQNESRLHFELYKKMPESCRKFVVKPLKVTETIAAKFPGSYIHAMEHVNGIEFIRILKSSSIKKEFKMKLIKELRRVVLCLWKNGFIHGDLHFHNVMVLKKGETYQIKLIDFGHSRRVTPLKKVSEKDAWFKSHWDAYKNTWGGNPNTVVFGTKIPMYAKTHKNIINNVMKKRSR